MQLQKNNEIPDGPKVYTDGCQPSLVFAVLVGYCGSAAMANGTKDVVRE
jgi:hypothetical protein